MLVLAKADLADPEATKFWSGKGDTLAVSLRDNKDRQLLLDFILTYLDENLRKRYTRPWRVMVVGIPNVGKSTLINLLAGRRSAKVGDKPGITLTKQWIKISEGLEMLDMPGILWPKIDDKEASLKLAVSGCIKDEILPIQEVARWLLRFLSQHYPQALAARFGCSETDLDSIAQKMGALRKGGERDLAKAADLLLRDFRAGRLGRITLDLEGE
jgi:ribosome biogenesis GTPase A